MLVSPPQSFGALPLRLEATMRPTARSFALGEDATDAVSFDATDTLPLGTHRPITSHPICYNFAIDLQD